MLLVIVLLVVVLQVGRAVNIGIIGGGIGGTSAAYFLREFFNDDVSIDLYEQSKIGGRLSTITIDEKEYEVGGSIIHTKNKHAVDLVKLMNLTKNYEDPNEFFGLFGDKGFVFTGSKYSFITNIKMLWRYKWQLIKLDRFLTDMLSHFSRIYSFQDQLNSFKDVHSLLYSADPKFVKYLTVTAKEGFKEDSFSQQIIDELLLAGLRCNYGQSTSVHKFVGSVSTSGMGADLFSIVGGNKLLAERLMKASYAKLINDQVISVDKTEGGKYIIKTNHIKSVYDFVIVATPLTVDQKSPIVFNIDVPVNVPGHYHTTIATIVKGNLNNEYFGYTKSGDVPDIILTVSENLFFNSVGRIKPVNGTNKKQIWKIFSRNVLSDNDLKKLFKNYIVLDVINWLAYPHYSTDYRNDSFELDQNLYYINAIEWAASAIEMSLIGAKNVALLIHKELQPAFQDSDSLHDEL
ncbi:prenylcysteine oxidase 1-like [Cimex lectularius]|uniref:Prenylcysteine lyase domain-containing protein n=1 Tax=Cimex lectularius TaxID=79782 RepID=A0A8I6S8X0_CIMLE|nr:prenylcysteine oxidase 1-like [Cimex lectularius]